MDEHNEHSLEDLIGQHLDEVVHLVAERFKTPANLRQKREEALKMPEVVMFRADYDNLIARAQSLAVNIRTVIGFDSYKLAKGAFRVEQTSQIIEAICPEHNIPYVVAEANLPEGVDIESHQFSHRDLTSSYHFEDIRHGKIYCKDHPARPAELSLRGTTMRVIGVPDKPPKAVVDDIVGELAKKFEFASGQPTGRHKPGKLKKSDIQAALPIILKVGELYDSVYQALEQTRHRAISIPYIAKTARLDLLPQSVKKAIGYDDLSRAGSFEQLAAQLTENPFFRLLEDIVGSHIPSPVIVIQERVKGRESFTEKLVLFKYWQNVVEAYKSHELHRHFKALGLPPPRPPKKDGPHPTDYYSMQVLIHDDRLNYGFNDLRSKDFRLTQEEADRITGKINALVESFSEQDRGYERQSLPKDRKGRKVRVRTRPDPKKPKLATPEKIVTSRRFVVSLSPEAEMFDDYAAFPKESGYTAIHMVVGSETPGMKGAVVELQVQPNIYDNYKHISREVLDFKTDSAAQLHCLRHMGIISDMFWETMKLLFGPEDRPYRETNIALMKI